MALDLNRIDDAVLALLPLGQHGQNRVWKSFNWDAMGRLHARGFISDPAGVAKSATMTPEGRLRAEELLSVAIAETMG